MPVRLALAAAILALSACQVAPVPGAATPTPTPAGSADVGGTFRVALTADPTTLDPWNANDANSLLVTRQIFETLVDYEPGGFKIVPKLAESWSVSSDGRSSTPPRSSSTSTGHAWWRIPCVARPAPIGIAHMRGCSKASTMYR